MTIEEARQYLIRRLNKIYEEGEVSTIGDWVLEKLTGVKKTEQIIQKNKLIVPDQESTLYRYTDRLLQHEPVQYVLNEAWFCGFKFYVDENVLIPRPETEELVEWIITNCKFPIDQLRILDIGSGSGCIPISLKRKLRKAEVWSCDININALEVARKNANNLGIDVNFFKTDFLKKELRERLPSFDIIVSNPPYIPEKDKEKMQPNVLKYEPWEALFVPDNDALVFYKAFADFGKQHLNKNGTFYMEIHENHGKDVEQLFQSNNYSTEIKKDMQGKERMLKASATELP